MSRFLLAFSLASATFYGIAQTDAAAGVNCEDRLRLPPERISIDAKFPGGNVVVETIEGDSVRLHQDPRDTPAFWFYWSFRVKGAQGRTINFAFTRGNVFGSRGPAVSVDGGHTWDWLGRNVIDGDSFRYAFGPNVKDVRFAFAIPYTERDLAAFLKRHAGNAALQREELVKTPRGRSAERLRAGRIDGSAAHRLLFTCRHHACESVANFVLEGVLDAALADTPTGRWYRDRVEILAVPFVDKDGVEDGDQGKLRKPHDHWLDYEGNGLYASTRALRAWFAARPALAVDIALDLHCPYIRDSKIYFALGPNARIAAATVRFSREFEQVQRGTLRYHMSDNSLFGTGWNVPATYDGVRSFEQWAETLPGLKVAATLEVPYAAVGDVTVTPENARRLGRDLAIAIRTFLEAAAQ